MHRIIRYGFKHFEFSKIHNPSLNTNSLTPSNYQNLASPYPYQQRRNVCTTNTGAPLHLVCLKDWDERMISTVICSALKLKCHCQDTHGVKLSMLPYTKVMILEDHNEPILRMAASKATSLLGANDVHIVDKIRWDQHYYGKIFSEMADIILVSTETHGCVRRFVEQSSVPVVCMKSRRHASVQSLATVMSMIEEYGTLRSLNVAYVGTPHQVLNDYLILCPNLGANFKFKCCNNKSPVSPLMYQDCKELCKKMSTSVEQVNASSKALCNVTVVISGPATMDEEQLKEFQLSAKAISSLTNCNWTFYHTCPRGKEVDDHLFCHQNARTYNAFKNTQYIAAALIMFTLNYSKYYQNPKTGCSMP